MAPVFPADAKPLISPLDKYSKPFVILEFGFDLNAFVSRAGWESKRETPAYAATCHLLWKRMPTAVPNLFAHSFIQTCLQTRDLRGLEPPTPQASFLFTGVTG